ncbi:hypothetical protein ABZY93_21975 [Streptomyces smyrnaeus]|uniref:hypothetical protein n=1 Tax=Streptomyces smyrnaeus TaxID=1387713 RepID=UPI0033BD58ED
MSDETTTPKKRTARKPVTKATPKVSPLDGILSEVQALAEELPDVDALVGGLRPGLSRTHFTQEAKRWEQVHGVRSSSAHPGWDSAILTAAFSALALADAEAARRELVTLAATAAKAIEAISRGES